MAFKSDNTSGICAEVLEKIIAVNQGMADAYGGDSITQQVKTLFNEVFEQQVSVFFVATGTAANCLALSALTPPYGAIFCQEYAHIHTDETNAPELFTGGAKLIPLKEREGKICPEQLEQAIHRLLARRPHHPFPATLNLTQATEWGTVYTAQEIQHLVTIAKKYGLRIHMDGARFANAVATLNQSPADLTWRLGIDVLSFGGTKNGALAAESVIFFNPELAKMVDYQQKRFGQLLSKMRFFSCQFEGLLKNDIWLRNARHANAMAQLLFQKFHACPDITVLYPVEANEVFAQMPSSLAEALRQQGLQFYEWEENQTALKTYRFVTSFDTSSMLIEKLSF